MPDKTQSLEQACLCAKIADDYRGKDTIVLDLTSITPIADYFVITTATSPRQMQAIAEEANRLLKAEGSRRLGIEGKDSGNWILQDYGDVVLHVFSPEARTVYDLERLWADAPRIDWQSQTGRAQ
jgi:ribosome-associated protein